MAQRKPHEKHEDLAPGEDPSTRSPGQAKRWVSVYEELIQLEESLIQSVKAKLATMSEEVRRVAEKTNLPDLEEDLDHFRERLAFWEGRVDELEG